MSEHEGPTPRRGGQPRDEDTPDGVPAEGADGRRGGWSATGPQGDVPTAGTPIPPPAVLPTPDVPAASAGRRFSAADLPSDEERPLPRRSALSPAATRARSPRTPDAGEVGSRRPRRGRAALWISLAVIAVVAAVVAAFLLLRPGTLAPPEPTPTPTPTVDPVATYLLQPADLAGMDEGTTWEAVTTATAVEATTPQPKCLLPAAETQPAPQGSFVRTFAPTGGLPGGVLHEVDTYATVQEASAAYDARVAQLAECTRNTAFFSDGVSLEGLADETTGVKLVLQDAEPEPHTLLLSRTGSRVNVVDATHPTETINAGDLGPVLALAAARQCGTDGTCPAPEVSAAVAVPPAAEPAGWLASVDLPRITAGAGQWRGTPEVRTTIESPGTRCEALDLSSVEGASSHLQRTYLLIDDTRAPANFGVDELLYTFSTPEEANTFAGTLTTNIDGCAGRTATAQVAKSADLSGVGTGAAWVVTQKVDQSEATARFRNAVLVVGNRVVYLMANPSNEFDFSDDAWHDVARRAGARATQLVG